VLWQRVLASAARLPAPLAYRVAGIAGDVKYRFQRDTMAMRPELERRAHDAAQLESWKRRQCQAIAYADMELSAFSGRRGRAGAARRDQASRRLPIAGLGHLDTALEKGNGAILYSLHLRGINTLFAALSVIGYTLNMVRHTPPSLLSPDGAARVRRREALLEAALGCRFLWMEPENFGVAVKAANALRRNEVVVMLVDKAYSKDAVEVDLLGTSATFVSGHVALAAMTGAPLLHTAVHRGQGHGLRGEVGPPLAIEADMAHTVQASAGRLEQVIVRHPELWYA
jgi:lauroyl/myristoyl acyltransferase